VNKPGTQYSTDSHCWHIVHPDRLQYHAACMLLLQSFDEK